MKELRYTLLADGPSDAALMRVIDWTLSDVAALADVAIARQFVDVCHVPSIPGRELRERAIQACQFYPCDVLFVHRDAEREPPEQRIREIESAVEALASAITVPIVPVRMTEAWLLHDEHAIRMAADNPNGTVALELPHMKSLERLPNPKAILDGLLVTASEKSGRRLAQFRSGISGSRRRVADLIRDLGAIRSLPAVQEFQTRTHEAIKQAMFSGNAESSGHRGVFDQEADVKQRKRRRAK